VSPPACQSGRPRRGVCRGGESQRPKEHNNNHTTLSTSASGRQGGRHRGSEQHQSGESGRPHHVTWHCDRGGREPRCSTDKPEPWSPHLTSGVLQQGVKLFVVGHKGPGQGTPSSMHHPCMHDADSFAQKMTSRVDLSCLWICGAVADLDLARGIETSGTAWPVLCEGSDNSLQHHSPDADSIKSTLPNSTAGAWCLLLNITTDSHAGLNRLVSELVHVHVHAGQS
jgi:hypothetical protein